MVCWVHIHSANVNCSTDGEIVSIVLNYSSVLVQLIDFDQLLVSKFEPSFLLILSNLYNIGLFNLLMALQFIFRYCILKKLYASGLQSIFVTE